MLHSVSIKDKKFTQIIKQGPDLLPIKLFSILEHAALITPSFRDRKSLTAALLETKEIYPLCIFGFRLAVLFFPSDKKIPDWDLCNDLA